MIYLDNAATTPVRNEVLEAMLPYFSKKFGNPSSIHHLGQEAREAVEKARLRVAKVLDAKPEEIIFTGSGTESVNLAIQGILGKKKGHVITSAIEHEAVLQACSAVGGLVSIVGVDKKGIVSPKDIEQKITAKTKLISIMYANNEIGTIQPISKIAKIAQKHNVIMHTDACQAGGLLNINVGKLGVDLITLNGSKIYGPKGIGILYVKKGVKLGTLLYGGGQEFGLRSGTENVAAIVGLARALELAQQEQQKEVKRLSSLRDYFIKELLKIPEVTLNGDFTQSLANNVNICIKGIDVEQLVKHLSEKKIYCSSGSACTSNSIEPSHVLLALGLDEKDARSCVRFSLGKETIKKDLIKVLQELSSIVQALRLI